MYAVISSGGKQYRVEPGSILGIERLEGEPGSSFTFERVLLIADGDRISVGSPLVAGASVAATILGADRGEKLVVFKFKPKVHYRRRTGHRQQLTRVRVDEIRTVGGTAKSEAAEEPKSAAEPKRAAKPMSDAKPKSAAKPKRAAKPKSDPAASAAEKPKRARSASTANGSAERGGSARKPKRAQPEE